MKLKFVLVPLMVLGLSVGSYADCSKDEIMKLIDKGYTKTEINGICGKNEPKKKKSKWFSPTNKKVTWKKAKEVCIDNGGRLPTLEELKRVVINCGGKMKDNNSAESERNINNDTYQFCYKEKGFTSNSSSWSSTTNASNTNHVWGVYFNGGYTVNLNKFHSFYVRCVRVGQ